MNSKLFTLILLILFGLFSYSQSQAVILQAGDSLEGLAETYNTTVDEILRVNGLSPNPRLYLGDVLYMKASDRVEQEIIIITIQEGDNLSVIAREYATSVNTLVNLNQLENSNLILAGASLRVPVLRSATVSQEVAISATETGAYRVVFDEGGRELIVMQAGDTLENVANEFNVNSEDLRTWNELETDVIALGDIIYVAPPISTINIVPNPELTRNVSTETEPDNKVESLPESTESINTSTELSSTILPVNPIILGQKEAEDQRLFNELLRQALTAADIEYETSPNLGNDLRTRQDIIDAEIDLYVDETGTALSNYFQGYGIASLPAEILSNQEAARSLSSSLDSFYAELIWLCPAPANNNFVFVAKASWAAEHKLESLSDLTRFINAEGSANIAMPKSFFRLSNGLPLFETAYGFKTLEFEFLDAPSAQKLSRLRNDSSINIMVMHSTDNGLQTSNLIVLEDDLNVQPILNPSPVVRLEVLEAYPDLQTSLCPVFDNLDNFALKLLKENLSRGQSLDNVVATYLREVGLTP